MSEVTRVLVADDHPLFRQGVVRSIDAEDDITVLGEAEDGDEAVTMTIELAPDVVVMDLAMPGGGGIDATRRISALSPATRILILTVSEDPHDLLDVLKAGARGYVLKGVAAQGLIHAIRAVVAGEVYVTAALAGTILHDMTRQTPLDPFDHLTGRERDVLELVARGMTNREIGEELYLAEKTVKHHMTNVLQKLQVRSRVEAALLAQRRSLDGE